LEEPECCAWILSVYDDNKFEGPPAVPHACFGGFVRETLQSNPANIAEEDGQIISMAYLGGLGGCSMAGK
jgi:hypothetical protein